MVVGDCLFANLDVLAVRIKSRFFFLLLWSVTNHGRNILDYFASQIQIKFKNYRWNIFWNV